MKGLNKILLIAAVAVPFAAQAELKSMDDAVMADVSGQSGLIIEAGFGTGPADLYGAHSTYDTAAAVQTGAWAGAGISIDAFKWEVDGTAWNSVTNTITNPTGAALPAYAGFVAQGIQVAGSVDVIIDAALDTATGVGGIGVAFDNSDINFRVDTMGVYVAGAGIRSNMGTLEIIGMNINGLDLVIHGNGL
jgi:Family of unknown function (DUF6160)